MFVCICIYIWGLCHATSLRLSLVPRLWPCQLHNSGQMGWRPILIPAHLMLVLKIMQPTKSRSLVSLVNFFKRSPRQESLDQSDQNAQLLATIDTMKKKSIELLALSETRWSGHSIVNICSTTILYSCPSNGVHGVAIGLSPSARYSWKAAGSVFHPVSERIIRICLKCHLSYVTVVAIYAPTNPSSSTTQAAAPSDTFYDQLQPVVSGVPPRDMLLVLGDFNARVGSDFQSWRSVIGPHGMGGCNGNEQLDIRVH